MIPLIIVGPTASGKSAEALRQAARVPSVIVNADSMQVYADLRVLTARPQPEDETLAHHALYGHVDGDDAYSVGRYVRDVEGVLGEAARGNVRPIIVGGTGLYLKALTEGLSPIPAIPGDIRARWRAEADALGAERLHGLLAERDPVMAGRLRPSDPQRVTRALEVLEATGISLARWQETPGRPVLNPGTCEQIVLRPDRATLYARADARFDAMIAAGAVDEVSGLLARGLDPALPVMRALGVPQLAGYVRGEVDLATAILGAKLETRRYIKRQLTWLRRNKISNDAL